MWKTFARRGVASSLAAGSFFVLTLSHAHSAETDQEMAAANFQLADANSDNVLSKAEFRTFIDLSAASNLGRAGMIKSTNRYDTAFSRLDADGNGAVTPAELSELGNGSPAGARGATEGT